MEITDEQIAHFHRSGFFLIPNPLDGETMFEADRLQRKNEAVWERTEWPKGVNRLACQFLMLGDLALEMVERPELVNAAKRILGCDEVHVGACGLGDASKASSAGERPVRQVSWHADGSPEVHQVSFRTALDRHDASNGPLRVLPGSHLRQPVEVKEELAQLELATGQHDVFPQDWYTHHPHEVEVILDPRWTLVWTPSCWHATGMKTAAGPRRAMGWNYFPPGGRKRDVDAVKQVFADSYEGWSEMRKRLWGLI